MQDARRSADRRGDRRRSWLNISSGSSQSIDAIDDSCQGAGKIRKAAARQVPGIGTLIASVVAASAPDRTCPGNRSSACAAWSGKLVLRAFLAARETQRLPAGDATSKMIVVSNPVGVLAAQRRSGDDHRVAGKPRAVGDRMPILVDSGFRRLLATCQGELAIGVRAVCVGRPYLWGLGAFASQALSACSAFCATKRALPSSNSARRRSRTLRRDGPAHLMGCVYPSAATSFVALSSSTFTSSLRLPGGSRATPSWRGMTCMCRWKTT